MNLLTATSQPDHTFLRLSRLTRLSGRILRDTSTLRQYTTVSTVHAPYSCYHYFIMTTSTTPTDAQSSSTALVESQPKKSSFLFLTPQVASYFVGELLCVLAGKRIGMTPFIFHSWRMCRSCLADGRQPAGTAEDHTVRFPLIFHSWIIPYACCSSDKYSLRGPIHNTRAFGGALLECGGRRALRDS